MVENTIQEITEANRLPIEQQFNGALDYIDNNVKGSVITKIPVSEIAAIGSSVASFLPAGSTGAVATETLYKCVFPKGVQGALAVKDGMNLGAIFNGGRIVGQARWEPVTAKAGADAAMAINPAMVLTAISILGITCKLNSIQKKQGEILGLLERDKKSQLLTDYEILQEYIDNYKYYVENEPSLVTNLNQTKNIKRNAKKDIKSYKEQIEKIVNSEKSLFESFTAASNAKEILNRFIHYKLATYVYSYASYLEIMITKNYQEEYLEKVEVELREIAFEYREFYTVCFNAIEKLKESSFEKYVGKRIAEASKATGKIIEKIPVVNKGQIDETLVAAGDALEKSMEAETDKTMLFFMTNKDSGIIPVVEHIEILEKVANKPLEIVTDSKVIYLVSRDEEEQFA